MMGANLEVNVAGHWLSMESFYGGVEMSTVWPGGSDELSWEDPYGSVRYRGGALVVGSYAGVPVWQGHLNEPDPSAGRLVAIGAFREGEDFLALDGSGNATTDVPGSVIAAQGKGLNWILGPIGATTVPYDISQGPLTLSGLLDIHGPYAGSPFTRWYVRASDRTLSWSDDPTTPAYQTLPLAGGLGYARDNYASTLIGRYRTSRGYATATVTDTVAEGLHGHVEAVVDLTQYGVLTSGQATSRLNVMLSLGRSIPQWTTGIEVVYGELLNMGGVPVALETVAAGSLVRVQTEWELAQRTNAAMYVDVLIGKTTLSEGTLTLEPLRLADRTLGSVVGSVATVAVPAPPGDGRASPKAPSPSQSATAFGVRTQGGATSLTSGTITDIPFGSTKEAAAGSVTWDGGTNSWIVSQGGIYHIVISCLFQPNATGRRNIQLWKNGAVYAIEEKSPGAMSANDPTLVLTVDVPCETGDTLTARAVQGSGGALNISTAGGDSNRHYFSIRA